MKALAVSLLILFTAVMLFAQSGHTVTLTWTASTDNGVQYNVYRASGVCTNPLPTMTKLGTVSTLTYQDTGVAPGTYCYYVTATENGAESAYSATGSNFLSLPINPAPPTTLQITVK